MKWFAFFLFVIPGKQVSAQEQINDSIVSYSQVYQVDSLSKTDIFNLVRTWFASTFKDSKAVIEISDKDAGQITGKGNQSTTLTHPSMKITYPYRLNFLIDVRVKDYKYKITLSNFQFEYNASSPSSSFSVLTSSKTCPDKWPMVRQKVTDDMWDQQKGKSKTAADDTMQSLYDYVMKNKATNQDF
jgi:hypothetical protein